MTHQKGIAKKAEIQGFRRALTAMAKDCRHGNVEGNSVKGWRIKLVHECRQCMDMLMEEHGLDPIQDKWLDFQQGGPR